MSPPCIKARALGHARPFYQEMVGNVNPLESFGTDEVNALAIGSVLFFSLTWKEASRHPNLYETEDFSACYRSPGLKYWSFTASRST